MGGWGYSIAPPPLATLASGESATAKAVKLQKESMSEYIYQMVKARKKVGDKLILDDVTMAFLPGAKIGMVGPNGAGKSTILKIMAGMD